MAVKLFNEHKCYWKVENVVEFQQRWRVKFRIPPTRVTIRRIRDKFEVYGLLQDVLKGRCGRKRSSTDNERADAVMPVFARSPKKSLRQCSRETCIEKSSVYAILQGQKLYSVSNNPDGMSLCSTLLLGVCCGRRWTF